MAIDFYSNKLSFFVMVVLADSLMVYPVLILVEFMAYSIEGSDTSETICIKLTINRIKQFVVTKPCVLGGTWCVA